MDRRSAFVASVLAIAATLLVSSPAASGPDVALGAGRANAITRGGASWTVTDELFDATGPELDGVDPSVVAPLRTAPVEDGAIAAGTGVFGAQRATTGGDFSLPTDRARWPDFTADIAGVRFDVKGNAVQVTIRFASMPRADAQIATVTFAAADQPGPSRPWPAGAGVRGPWQAALTVAGSRAVLSTPIGAPVAPLTVTTGDHTLRATVPASSLPPRPWEVVVGAGLADPADPNRYWSVPAGLPLPDRPGARGQSAVALWDVSGTRSESAQGPGAERAQASLLASQDLTTAANPVGDPSVPMDNDAPAGTYTRNYVSGWDGGDGLRRDPSGVGELGPPPGDIPLPDPGPWTGWTYTGRLQHYAMHVPASYRSDSPAPLLVYLHGSGGDVTELFDAFPDFVTSLSARGYLVAAPLGRGDTFYRPGPGELDVLEAIADIRAAHNVDADRIFLLGFSGGAAGVNVLTSRHPDLFAGAVSVVATFEEPSLVDNIATVPWLGITGEADPLTHALDGPGLYQALSDRGGDATLLRYAAKTHEFSLLYDSVPTILDFLGRQRRDASPPAITWVTKPGDARPELGLDRGGAWWLGDVEPADPTAGVRIAVRSRGTGRAPSDPASAARTESVNVALGRSGRAIARVSTTRPPAQPAVTRENRIELDAANVRAARIDLRATGLTADEPLTVVANVDHELRLTLVGHGGRDVAVPLAVGSSTVVVTG